MTEQNDPMKAVYDEIDEIILEVGADDPNLLRELTQAWGRNPLVMQHIRFKLGPTRAVFDMHLGGDGVHEHSIVAHYVASLLSGVTDASKEIAKQARQLPKLSNDYLVRGVMPGSVRLVIEAPNVRPRHSRRGPEVPEEVRPAFHQPSEESNALRTVAELLSAATPGLETNLPLDRMVKELPPTARSPLRSVAVAVRDGNFEIEGDVRERGRRPVDLTFTPDRAVRLAAVIDQQPVVPTPVTKTGLLDGFRKSSHMLYLAPSSDRPIAITVHEDEMLEQVAQLNAIPDQHVRVRYLENRIDGMVDARRQDARVLKSIEAISGPSKEAEQLTLLDPED
ncbi:hypothetical protein [Brachybacterium kimchii]|uniref:Helicase XPB/Ssl2 N-terminal domain-containing protein n=1 Tax=Brachybacterium kimchii TaxID=2942909 RepID=A0ABY4NA76_9MICO|nr:hypothetical protein [Brachybacterium kimchii]UQN30697.1 hypothetical protein M4486_05175 [Brachybacterium kimchii]